MTAALAQLVLLSMVCFAALGAALTAAVYPRVRTLLAKRTPAARAHWTSVWLALPVILALALTAACILPSIGPVVASEMPDHCLSHPDDHLHLCLVHPPRGAGGPVGWVVLAAVGLLWTRASVRVVWRLVTARRTLTAILDDAGQERQLDVTWLRCAVPVASSVGLLRPRIVISDSLRVALRPRLLAAVIAHERAHVRRRDVARRAVATLLALLHLPPLRKLLLEDLVTATELAADAAAAAELGETLCVADAILAVERLAGEVRPSTLAIAFGETSVSARIEALLAPPASERRCHRVLAAVAGVSIGALLAPALHHGIETILSRLVG